MTDRKGKYLEHERVLGSQWSVYTFVKDRWFFSETLNFLSFWVKYFVACSYSLDVFFSVFSEFSGEIARKHRREISQIENRRVNEKWQYFPRYLSTIFNLLSKVILNCIAFPFLRALIGRETCTTLSTNEIQN